MKHDEMKQEPVAWMYHWTTNEGEFIQNWTTSEAESLRDTEPNIISNVRPLYTHPQQRTWVGLIPEEIEEIIENSIDKVDALIQTMDKLKEKNT